MATQEAVPLSAQSKVTVQFSTLAVLVNVAAGWTAFLRNFQIGVESQEADAILQALADDTQLALGHYDELARLGRVPSRTEIDELFQRESIAAPAPVSVPIEEHPPRLWRPGDPF
jgi:hypothetical protein